MLSIQHIIIIFVVALVVFGPEKLPELARTLGKAMAEFRKITGDLRTSFEDQMRELERETAIIEAKKRHLEAEQRALAEKPALSPGTAAAETAENSIGGGRTESAPAEAKTEAAVSEQVPARDEEREPWSGVTPAQPPGEPRSNS